MYSVNFMSVKVMLHCNWMGREESQEWDLSGQVEGVGLISWVNTRPLACMAPATQVVLFPAGSFVKLEVSVLTFLARHMAAGNGVTSQSLWAG